ncbi:MAG TPA: hypothetical protein VFS60_17225 [Thermoanaerobaculia bacterium]|nr:hypothetical protein [Thermoanaerobaculia bacterium]
MRKPASTLTALVVVGVLVAACGTETAMMERLAGAGPPAPVKARVAPAAPPQVPEPPPPPSASSLTLAGDFTVEDDDPDVVVEPLPATNGRTPRMRLELRHRTGGSSQPDAVVVFLNVPAEPGTYALRAPQEPLVPVRVYAFVTTRGEALGSMKDFNSAVSGTLTLRREATGLVGTFRVAAQEPPPPPPPKLLPGELPPSPLVGTIPPAPPGRVEATGTLLALLPGDRAVSPADVAPASNDTASSAPAPRRDGGARKPGRQSSGRESNGRLAALPWASAMDRTGG